MVDVAAASFAELLKLYRAGAGLTQEELAEQAGLSARAISDLERGVKKHPYPHTVQRLAHALELHEEASARFRQAARRSGAETGGVAEPAPRRRLVLPIQPTVFIGRRRELGEVRTLLEREEVRLLTLTGPGGVGKTRLALRLAEEAAPVFPDGIVFVSVASVTDPELVASAIATALGVREGNGQTTFESVIEHLRQERMLLLLDNFEHLLPATGLISQLLVACPQLSILVTSRAVLHLAAEWEYQVPPLPVPTPGHLPDLKALERYDAVQLFVQRAQPARPTFRMTKGNAPAIAEICSRLDGLPLAIELAAARIRLFPPDALLRRLKNRLELLTGGARDVSPRQQSLRHTVDWSYRLLDPAEQVLFAWLGVFAGGCTLEAAEAVCGVGEDHTVIDRLGSLVETSLLQAVDGVEGGQRLLMLETIREYAAERLEHSGGGASARSRHALYYLALVEETASQPSGADETHWLDRLEDEHDNVRAALRWAVDQAEGEVILRFVRGLGPFWLRRGYVTEGLEWVRQALAVSRFGPTAPHVETILLAADMLGWLNDYEAVIALVEEALPPCRQLGDQRALCRLLGHLQARAGIGDLAGGIRALEESVSVARELGSPLELARALGALGPLARLQGATDRADTLLREAETISRQHGFTGELAVQLETLGDLAIEHGEYEAARACFVEGLQINRARGARMRMTTLLYGFAKLAVAERNCERAALLFAAEEAGWARLGQPLDGLFVDDRELLMARARSEMSAEAWVRSWEQGQAMSLEGAVAYALDEDRHAAPSA